MPIAALRHIPSVALFAMSSVVVALAGPLTPPPGPISPTPGPEPRTPLNSFNTPGDATSVFRIDAPGSYYLTTNLVATGGKSGITIVADNVTLDLNGFTIEQGDALGFPIGISTNNTNRRGLVVRNGNINNFKGYGIFGQARDSLFEDLTFHENKSGSLELFQADDCTARNIRIFTTTGEAGLQLSNNARVENCVVDGGNTGIMVSGNSVVTGCVLVNQPSVGITIFGGLVEDCSVSSTKNANSFNAGGINAGGSVIVRNCSIRGIASAGIFIGGDATIKGCSISSCVKGIASSQFSGGSTTISDNDIADCSTVALDLLSGKHLVIGNRFRGNASNINAGPSVAFGAFVACVPGVLPAAAANPTANLVW
ncbi:MAG: right-handed parallel beta-helix repeat-containing protein [Phycisphaerales bacterium]|nr:right-handed parallel beta-helix repeat-containing protein [Planctomycetota bacterium]